MIGLKYQDICVNWVWKKLGFSVPLPVPISAANICSSKYLISARICSMCWEHGIEEDK